MAFPLDPLNAENTHYLSRQSSSVPKKDGQPDTRPLMERRRYTDDGGHLLASMFNGPGEQINYVPMAMSLNQAGGGWYEMEQKLKKALRGKNPPPPYPQKVEVEIGIAYSANKRPLGFGITQWIAGVAEFEQFQN